MLPANHTIHRHCHHNVWDRAMAPVLTIAPGETATFEIADASGGQIVPGVGAEVFANYHSDRVNLVTGPVYVDGARPGDTLIISLEHYAPSGWGWTANIPGFGLLADEFPEAALRHWHFEPNGSRPMLFGDLAQVRLAPFAGTIGVAPGEPGPHSIIPPRRVGGNMDVRDLRAGSILHLPVEVVGALFSIGDTHAAQGDGEVCGTAIESPMQVTVRFDLTKGDAPTFPWIDAPAEAAKGSGGRVAITTGIGPDLMTAAQDAVRGMIDVHMRRHGLAAVDAYMLASVAGDLRIAQVVDAPNWTVTFYMPDAIFAV